DVDEALARLRRAELALGRRQRAQLVDAVQVGAGDAVRLAFVEVAAHADEAVGEREQRLGLRDDVEVERGFVERPRLDAKPGMRDHGASRSAARSCTTTSAPCWLSAALCPTRSTPTTQPKWPARPASTPASASSNTTASAGSTPSACAAARNVSGAGLPARCSAEATVPSTRASNMSSMPADSSTALQCFDADTTAVFKPASRTACRKRT